MEKGVESSLFVNDGSFMEKFKQMQQEMQKKGASSESKPTISYLPGAVKPTSATNKVMHESEPSKSQKVTPSSSSGKLAFSLKQKSKLAVPSVKLGVDEEEDEGDTGSNLTDMPVKRRRLGQPDASESSSEQGVVAPPPPSDPFVKKIANRLATFVAKHGKQFELTTRQKNPGDTPFKFLFDTGCPDYKYYEFQLAEEEKILAQTREYQASSGDGISGSSRTISSTERSSPQQSNYHIPASALYDSTNDGNNTIAGNNTSCGEACAPPPADPIAMMEYYMKKAAQEERRRPPKQSKDEMPPPASLQAPEKKGHHMGDYIPQEELERFLASCNDAAAQKAAREASEKAKIQADSVGHRLLSKMGWKEGEGLGSSRSGRADPVQAGNVKLNNLGVGAEQPGEVTPEDDIYEQYKKRMMLGYRYRPNPLNNPRKAYY